MGNRLYNRGVAVTIAKPIAGQFFETQPNAVRIENLRVQFEVTKSLASEPNSARVIISNLAERTRGELNTRPLYVQLDAGYDGNLERLFAGDLRWDRSVHEGPDWETTIELGDGERAFRFGSVSRSYRPGVDGLTAVRELARAMGAGTPRLSAAARTELRSQYAGGLTLHGNASAEMSRVLARYGMSWSFQDGRLQILTEGESLPGTAQLVSPDSGLIGTPAFGAPEREGGPPILPLRMLLRPAVLPGGRIQLESRTIRGIFRVIRVVHVGDTHGGEWVTEVECLPI